MKNKGKEGNTRRTKRIGKKGKNGTWNYIQKGAMAERIFYFSRWSGKEIHSPPLGVRYDTISVVQSVRVTSSLRSRRVCPLVMCNAVYIAVGARKRYAHPVGVRYDTGEHWSKKEILSPVFTGSE